jgi:hypothetical protein
MKKKLRNIIAILCCVTALAVGARSAENRSEFEIPFEFIVKKQTFPAGKYSVARLNAANPDVLILKQVGGKLKTVILARRIGGDEKMRAQSHLSFRRGDAGFYLTEIWEAEGNFGYRVWSAEIEREGN